MTDCSTCRRLAFTFSPATGAIWRVCTAPRACGTVTVRQDVNCPEYEAAE